MTTPAHQIFLYVLYVVLTLSVLLAFGYGAYSYYTRATFTIQNLSTELASTTIALEHEAAENLDLAHNLMEAQAENEGFASQIRKLSGTVSTLDKLAKTDPELLKKYSKIYFLSENYTPPSTRSVNKKYLVDETRTIPFLSEAYPYLTDLLDEADDDDLELKVASGYRSFTEQKSLKTSYTVTYGTGANSFSAEQGYSEHQLGTTVDFTTTGLKGGLTGFDKTDEYAWLMKNAYKYGFVISYPLGNGYYTYEPWHWRFVGVDLARDLHNDKKNFYDLDQREIDSYLISLFD